MHDLEHISLTGRLCYLFLCMERYLLTLYPETDWMPWAQKSWQWTNRYWNEGRSIYDVVVPTFLFEYESYEETNGDHFDFELTREDYDTFTALYENIAHAKGIANMKGIAHHKGMDDSHITGASILVSHPELCEVLFLPVEFSRACEGAGLPVALEGTDKVLQRMAEIMSEHAIPLPPTDTSKLMQVQMTDTGESPSGKPTDTGESPLGKPTDTGELSSGKPTDTDELASGKPTDTRMLPPLPPIEEHYGWGNRMDSTALSQILRKP